jgi:hypothetical protein
MALLNARSADTGKRNARRTQQSAAINLSPSRGIAEGSTQHTEHRTQERSSNTVIRSRFRGPDEKHAEEGDPEQPRRRHAAPPHPRAHTHTHTSPPGKCSRVLGATPQEKEAGEKWSRGKQRGSLVRLLHFAITWSSRSSCRGMFMARRADGAARKVEEDEAGCTLRALNGHAKRWWWLGKGNCLLLV